MCQVHTGVNVSLLAPGKPTIPLATQERLPRMYCTSYLSLRIRTTTASQLQKGNKENKIKQRKGKKRQESENTKKKRKEEKIQEKQETPREGEEARGKEKEKKRTKSYYYSRS